MGLNSPLLELKSSEYVISISFLFSSCHNNDKEAPSIPFCASRLSGLRLKNLL